MMISLKMWCLLPLAVLLMSITPTVTEVVQGISQCKGFLLENSSPQVPDILEKSEIQDQTRYKIICQTYKDKRRFVTLYDTKNKIPVFSAYKFTGEGPLKEDQKRPCIPWKTEPQLEERDSVINMWDDKYKNQAGNCDYRNQKEYDRGHLFPCSHAFDKSHKISTFTLTNAVPQVASFNQGSWQRMENCLKCFLQRYCINNNGKTEAYVVTGAQPSNNNKLNNRVNIPSVLWTAFCCYSINEKDWFASAYWGDNVQSVNTRLPIRTLQELYDKLSTGNKRFEAFPNTHCPLKKTVAKFYPDINKKAKKNNCDCLPGALE